MQPPLTGAHKNNVRKSNKRQYFTEKKNLVDRCLIYLNLVSSFRSVNVMTLELSYTTVFAVYENICSVALLKLAPYRNEGSVSNGMRTVVVSSLDIT